MDCEDTLHCASVSLSIVDLFSCLQIFSPEFCQVCFCLLAFPSLLLGQRLLRLLLRRQGLL